VAGPRPGRTGFRAAGAGGQSVRGQLQHVGAHDSRHHRPATQAQWRLIRGIAMPRLGASMTSGVRERIGRCLRIGQACRRPSFRVQNNGRAIPLTLGTSE
jgi:hypothetical protein